jgi:GntR family transcriptional regulator
VERAVTNGQERSPDNIRRALLSVISSGTVGPGHRLGSERVLAAQYGVTRTTVRQALDDLERDDIVRRVQGRGGGIFVAGPKIERDLSKVLGIPALLREQGLTAGTRVVKTGIIPADQLTADALDLQSGELVYELVRLRLAEGMPISFETARLPAARFPGLLERPLGVSIFELLADHYDTQPCQSVEQIEVEQADAREAKLLGIDTHGALMAITRTTSDQNGVPFEYSLDLFRADRIRIVVKTPGAPAVNARSSDGQRQQIELTALPGGTAPTQKSPSRQRHK